MNNEKFDSYIELASLVAANISGPVKYKLIQKAQEKLVKSLEMSGAVSAQEAAELFV